MPIHRQPKDFCSFLEAASCPCTFHHFSGSDLDDCYTAVELCETLLQLLPLVVGLRAVDAIPQQVASLLDAVAGSLPVEHDGVVLRHLDLHDSIWKKRHTWDASDCCALHFFDVKSR